MSRGSIMLAAGGTGGHLFPAQALGEELARRGYEVDLITDTRGTVFGAEFPARKVYKVAAATFKGHSPIEATKTLGVLGHGFQASYRIMGEAQPRAIIGFGGYPTLAPVLAAMGRGIPSAIHEQNSVMGQANRFLAPMVKAIACSFENTKYLEGRMLQKARVTGSPLRQSVLALKAIPYRPPSSQAQLNLLIVGGSQGARYLSDILPQALQLLPDQMRDRLFVMQQCREEDIDRVFDTYEGCGIAAELATFFEDLPSKMSNSHLIVARSGATTVAELCALGRPAIMVPLPHAKDNDQLENATRMETAGAGWCFPQATLTPENLAATVRRLFEDPTALVRAATGAHALANYRAVENLADLLEELAEKHEFAADAAATA
ncbi:UDP-diphospho-muramoylpentapeptide beta-N-acetylglucosaminyltransferase [Rhodomicrobium udaipurense JA643]|uniref:UDP-N-acetylglucosamine--N-acetylmuramyl-(pentapeptide) pyrophosphoryl-undecaprenol N-acetylglucosamine transferase n=1 Tax=Rhodomicrobium udaipurense TaxID=1202716 RepID=A0A8I1GIC7_9HYPH|nr:undecaprenyldiphospho-muramoylpentapeptide beta-N-acetylglucosaminyltransferase [Rhodomicrobium udaipurense]KAI95372.1 UDP-diphospho-muramoylpentapeptide beta-N-acetylglucosaminyltransferase [Rhodomicrobium udaipurense JA643]MBJ7544846.1 undecaprenyldiphospho-muramoylpentapeptide beta-N-acetylglucosaminyltransferase [Rhodomicrobium udaipurense]